MKKLVVASVVAVALLCVAQQQASAWCNFNFGVGFNVSMSHGKDKYTPYQGGQQGGPAPCQQGWQNGHTGCCNKSAPQNSCPGCNNGCNESIPGLQLIPVMPNASVPNLLPDVGQQITPVPQQSQVQQTGYYYYGDNNNQGVAPAYWYNQ